MEMDEKTVTEILMEENVILDCVLANQEKLHSSVKEKNWVNLEKIMGDINDLTAQFSELDVERDKLIVSGCKLTKEENELMFVIRSKLLKSKIENHALNTYIDAAQTFIRGVLDNVVPQRRNVLYSRRGKIIKHEPQSVVLNKVL